mmetsp:Transcript_26555/g.63114  ORF Transcript_26555/g.63114 Transcript_26555/m.63114 type:complete len:333 (+) Transcript_26555:236-1234(+)
MMDKMITTLFGAMSAFTGRIISASCSSCCPSICTRSSSRTSSAAYLSSPFEPSSSRFSTLSSSSPRTTSSTATSNPRTSCSTPSAHQSSSSSTSALRVTRTRPCTLTSSRASTDPPRSSSVRTTIGLSTCGLSAALPWNSSSGSRSGLVLPSMISSLASSSLEATLRWRCFRTDAPPLGSFVGKLTVSRAADLSSRPLRSMRRITARRCRDNDRDTSQRRPLQISLRNTRCGKDSRWKRQTRSARRGRPLRILSNARCVLIPWSAGRPTKPCNTPSSPARPSTATLNRRRDESRALCPSPSLSPYSLPYDCRSREGHTTIRSNPPLSSPASG